MMTKLKPILLGATVLGGLVAGAAVHGLHAKVARGCAAGDEEQVAAAGIGHDAGGADGGDGVRAAASGDGVDTAGDDEVP